MERSGHARLGGCRFVAIACSFLAVSVTAAPPAGAGTNARESLRERIRERVLDKQLGAAQAPEIQDIAGLKVAIWAPANAGVQAQPAPVVVFSHGYRGFNRQSEFIMQALADAGFLVVAPNHADAFGSGRFRGRPEVSFVKPQNWNETTYKRRGEDIVNILAALKEDPRWSGRIDWSRIALIGHSLGGYTVLGLAGAWPSWRLPQVKAVIALSPYCAPYLQKGTLDRLQVPVMYQGGTADVTITPFLKGKAGAFTHTPGPAYLVELKDANHFTWTNLNKQKAKERLINYYCLSFLNRFLNGDAQAKPELQLPGVATLVTK